MNTPRCPICGYGTANHTPADHTTAKARRLDENRLDQREALELAIRILERDGIQSLRGLAFNDDEIEALRDAVERDPEACPGCGRTPSDGITPGCNQPEGCGAWTTYTVSAPIGPTPFNLCEHLARTKYGRNST